MMKRRTLISLIRYKVSRRGTRFDIGKVSNTLILEIFKHL